MTKAAEHVTIGAVVALVYFASIFNYLPIFPALVQNEILPVLPLWTLITFGAYLLGSMGWHLLIFNDAPEAQAALMKEIDAAKKELTDMGVDVE